MNTNSQFTNYSAPAFMQGPPSGLGTPTPRGRGRGTSTGAKRGRKPRGSLPNVNVDPHPLSQGPPITSQPTTVQWAQPITQMPSSSNSPSDTRRTPSLGIVSAAEQSQGTSSGGTQSQGTQGTVLSLPGTMPILPVGAGGTMQRPAGPAGADEDGDGDDELLPAMADDDFAAQSSWNSQSKDNLKCVGLLI
jgi:transcription initiation factor TFIID subunit 11